MNLREWLFGKRKKVDPQPPTPQQPTPRQSEPSLYGRQEAIAKPKVSISARVIRKDGTIENLGRLK